MKTITSALAESVETKPESVRPRIDWIVIAAALGVGFLIHLMLTSDSMIFPAFIGAILLNYLVGRVVRRSRSLNFWS